MIAEKLLRNVEALRVHLAPLGAQLPPLTVSLLDDIENEAERVAMLENAAVLDFENPNAIQRYTHE